jgi:TonB family protein
VKSPERSTALSNDTVQIPIEEEPDAAVAAVEEPEVKKPNRPAQDPWACPGDLPASDIRKVLSEQQASIRSCYERALRNDNQLQGSVELQVRIGSDGKVSNTRIHGSLRDPEVSKCIQNLARNWVFHAPSNGNCAVFNAPYHFTPKQ